MTGSTLQIHQSNDSEILEFFNVHEIDFRLIGDHLFVIRCREGDAGAGPGDWLYVAPDGSVGVTPGDDAPRAALAIAAARRMRPVQLS
jgi:hypothetical protein